MKDYYNSLTEERHREIMTAYSDFISKLDNLNAPAIKVYKPLQKKNIDDIIMIRQMSRELQQKKDDDMKKAAQAATEAAEEAEKARPEKVEEKQEPPEVEKEN